MQRTPVIGELPLFLHRKFKPEPTPVIDGAPVRKAADLVESGIASDAEIAAAVQLAGVAPEFDPSWADAPQQLYKSSCAYFASEVLRGPKEAPYNGRFILGQHHLEWDDLIAKYSRLNILAARDHGKCTSSGSLVISADGRRIPIEDWKGGDVIAYDSSDYSLVKTLALGSQSMGLRECVKVTTRTGRTETVTLNHRFLTVDGDVYAGGLQLGTRIAVPRKLPVEGTIPLRPGEAWLIALLNGDGGLTGSSPTLSKSDSLVVEYARWATAQVGGRLSNHSTKDKYGFVGILDWARSIGIMGKSARVKEIPTCIFTAPNADVAEYIAGAIDTDCNVNPHGGGTVEFCSTSEHLLRGIQHLLTRFGVVAVLTEKHGTYKGEPYLSWLLNVRGQSICTLSEAVNPKGLRGQLLLSLAKSQCAKAEGGSVDLLPKAVYEWLGHTSSWFRRRGAPGYSTSCDLTRSKAIKLAELEGNNRLSVLAKSDVMWDEIVKIEPAGKHETYSFTVPGYETYVGQDIVNHNSFFFTIAFSIWKAGYNEPGSHGVIFSATQPQAEEFLGKIKTELLTNPKLAHLIPYTRDRFWSAKKITLRNKSVIRAAGFGVKIRGGHPDWAVCDDILNDDDIYSETIRRRNIDYFLSAIAGMVHRRKQLIVVGCVTLDTSVLTETGWRPMADLAPGPLTPQTLMPWAGGAVLGKDGMATPEAYWVNGECATKRIKLVGGYGLEGSCQHPVWVMGRSGVPDWRRLDDLELGDMVAVDMVALLSNTALATGPRVPEFTWLPVTSIEDSTAFTVDFVIPDGHSFITNGIVSHNTPMHHGDLYAELAATGVYECRSYPALDPDTGQPLWSDRYSLDDLEEKKRELKSPSRFAREYLCQPLSDDASLFPSKLFAGDDIRLPYVLGLPAAYWEKRGFLRYSGVDIAMSAETGGDYFVIFTVAVNDKGERFIANMVRAKGMSFTSQIDAIKDEYHLMRPEVIHIEANQMQRVWTDVIVETTDIPVRKFFTLGIGGTQPDNAWKKGATNVSVNKHHLDRGVPALRMTLEHRKWRIPRGDARSIELTDYWMGEMTAIGWIDGKVRSVGKHDDCVLACWMCDTAIRMGGFDVEWLDSSPERFTPDVLAAPRVSGPGEVDTDFVAAEKHALAACQQMQQVDVGQDAYISRVRTALNNYAMQLMDGEQLSGAAHALQAVKRLDEMHSVRSYDAEAHDAEAHDVENRDPAEYLG